LFVCGRGLLYSQQVLVLSPHAGRFVAASGSRNLAALSLGECRVLLDTEIEFV
jgi:hypothetical protein